MKHADEIKNGFFTGHCTKATPMAGDKIVYGPEA
jgi:hypothetical protein